ncbi:hypothetical protein PCANC_14355 [Puccinia coronata f. sp. avenae]|nr:hypothetical protein PCASD_22284 [Puccinia coronata f. sp. avenae]PLW13881.1 hypothetical protein PCANC_19948 [Puccinia coronata f. sp. avenae]PLW46638.1 hypothetical protein PCANC_14355 [Puccinia coronata f. sp. avenae]
MPSIKGKMRKEEDSDSDESFHCCGRPQDLIEEARFLAKTPPPDSDANEIHVPDDQEYYLYAAGLERMSSPKDEPTPLSPSSSSSHGTRFHRSSTVYSSDSDRTRIGSPLLIIKTGAVVAPSSLPEMKGLRVRFIEPPKPRTKLKWNIKIPRPQSFSKIVNPTDDSLTSPDLPQPQTPALHTPSPTRSSKRRQGMVFNLDSLPEELQKMAEKKDSEGSGT